MFTRRMAPMGGWPGPRPRLPMRRNRRRRRDLAHHEVGDGNILDAAAINRLEREAAAALEHTVGDGNIFETAVGLGCRT